MVYNILVIAAQILYSFMINVIQSLKPAGAPQQQPHGYKGYKPHISSECAWAATCGDGTSINMHTLEQKIYFRRQPHLSQQQPQPNLSQEQPQQQTQIELMA
jgi:hypothetical protein